MKKQFTYLLSALFLCIFSANATEYWLSPSGNDSNDGKSEAKAFKTPQKAMDMAQAGDQVWVTGGTYPVSATVKTKNSGTKDAIIKFFAVKGEKPVFDCSSMRNKGNESSTYRGLDLRQNWWHVKGINISGAGYNGIIIAGENITLEGCAVYDCGHDGITLGGNATNTLVLNCDSYRNCEYKGKGENGDGFSAKAGGLGNVFRGCRAWDNVDDGWDCYGGESPVLIDSCYSFGNGIASHWPDLTTFQGDGNGFKLGGGGGVTSNAPHVVLNSCAFDNIGKGFDQNHNSWYLTCINCTGYNNGGDGNFAFQETPASGCGKHTMINNLSYKGVKHDQTIAVGSIETNNSWNLGLNFSDDVFVSLNTSDAIAERDENYKLPAKVQELFQLKSNNPAIDKGIIVDDIRLKTGYAIPYCGTAIDLGAKEYVEGNWTFPEPKTPEENPEEKDPEKNPDDGGVEITKLVNQAATFTVNKNSTSQVWGPFCISSAEKAAFDMQAVGSSSGALIIEYSKDNSSWTQVGAQAKNGSTSLVKDKVIDLSGTPAGTTIYFRFKNSTNNDVKVTNLIITGKPTIASGVNFTSKDNINVVSESTYTISGVKTNNPGKGIFIKKIIYKDGSVSTIKLIQ